MTAKHDGLQTKDVVNYFVFPGIMPRLKELGGSGFGYLAFLIATVYQAVRILPYNHPYTKPDNIGKFGIRSVLIEAANRVKLGWGNIDQIIVFFAILIGLVVLFLQVTAFILAIITNTAFAANIGFGGTFGGIFSTPFPQNDIAFLMLDYVFGVPGLYGSDAQIPQPIHIALQEMFRYYNSAMLIVAVFIFLYFVVVVVTETAQTGTPFGQRFNSVYAPFRLVAAIGLLVPLGYGFNAAQYIVFYAAKYGSGMATNGWIIFNQTLENSLGVPHEQLVARPKASEMDALVQFMTTVHTCRDSMQIRNNITIDAYIVVSTGAQPFSSVDYETARDFYEGGDIEILFGERDSRHSSYAGNVRPYCGSLTIPVRVRATDATHAVAAGHSAPNNAAGPEWMQEAYYIQTQIMWEDRDIRALGERFSRNAGTHHDPCHASSIIGDAGTCQTQYRPPSSFKQMIIDFHAGSIQANTEIAWLEARDFSDLSLSQDILERGWGGAGIWYQRVAQINGDFATGVFNIPTVRRYPETMEAVREANTGTSGRRQSCEIYAPTMAGGTPISLPGGARELEHARVLDDSFQYWTCDRTTADRDPSGNMLIDAINVAFGTDGLFSLRENSPDEVHPIAAMASIGKSLIQNTIQNVGRAMFTSAMGGLASGAGDQALGAALSAVSSFFTSVATIGLAAGFILFYILPFLPFIYFFFAVGAWVKTIFEANCGVCLWALAHLKIDGDGFPTESAGNGYFLILEIFLRPILIVFGLIGGSIIFTSLASILYEIFDLVIVNVTGFAEEGSATGGGGASAGSDDEFRRNRMDEFFFTLMYAVIMYLMATASFKMIDMIPNFILRWIGSNVPTFGDQHGDATEGLVQYAAIGGQTIGGQLIGASTQGSSAVGRLGGAVGSLGR